MSLVRQIQVLDSHTGGEPTRVVIEGGPELGDGSVAERAHRFRHEHDRFRRAIVCEPRGSDVLVGALLVEPADSSNTAGVIFFNNVGVLGMCGHGTIGLMVTLASLGRISEGSHRIETPVGVVTATLHGDRSVSVANVPSYRTACAAPIQLANGQVVTGDVAWGGNWFYLCADHNSELELSRVSELTDFAWNIRRGVNAQGFPKVDHIELIGPPRSPAAAARNFVLCPGGAYDRSPCGTGTSAKLACLAADDSLAEGEAYVIESILGSTFTARFRWLDRAKGIIEPTITGTAHVNGEAKLLLDEQDPFCWGIR